MASLINWSLHLFLDYHSIAAGEALYVCVPCIYTQLAIIIVVCLHAYTVWIVESLVLHNELAMFTSAWPSGLAVCKI